MYMHAHVCTCVCVCMFVCLCVCVCVCVLLIKGNIILPVLLKLMVTLFCKYYFKNFNTLCCHVVSIFL